MTILHDSIPGRFEDVAERKQLRDRQQTAYCQAFKDRQKSGLEDEWLLELGQPMGKGGAVRSARLIKVPRH